METPGPNVHPRIATPADAQALAALATYVFLHTYAREGLRADLAREAFTGYSADAFSVRLAAHGTQFLLAQVDGHLVGFAESTLGAPCPADPGLQAELVRLYIHPRFQRRGIGRTLLCGAQAFARDAGAAGLWLSAWQGNHEALAFYARCGWHGIGSLQHVIEGTAYENQVLALRFDARNAASP